MAEHSGISWTDHTFNPWMGCTKVSPACKNCYAERDMDHRFGKVAWGPNGTRSVTSDANWKHPLRWNRTPLFRCDECGNRCEGEPIRGGFLSQHSWDRECFNCGASKLTRYRARVFCASLADVFEDWDGPIVDNHGLIGHVFLSDGEWGFGPNGADGSRKYVGAKNVRMLTMADVRNRLFALIDATPNLDWLLLTKRPENISKMWPKVFCDNQVCEASKGTGIYCPNDSCDIEDNVRQAKRLNVWLGASVENKDYLHRIDSLKSAGSLASVLFLSCEPLLGPMPTLGEHLDGIDWVITGGESGPGAREPNPSWFRSIRDQCEALEIPFHFKQWGEWLPDTQNPNMDQSTIPHDYTGAIRVGTKQSGRLLDGVLHDAFPKAFLPCP